MTDVCTPGHKAAGTEGEGESGYIDSVPVSVFQGTNSVIGSARAAAVTGTIKRVSGRSEIRYQFCQDTESLSEALNITQSANIGFGLFGASEKTEFLKNTKQTSFSLNLVIYARHVTNIETASDWSLRPGIAVPRSDEEKKSFFNYYGDSFVSALGLGGEYYAVYSFYTQSYEEQRALTAELSANGIFDGGSFGADFQKKIENSVSRTSVRVSMNQMVTGLRNPQLPAAGDIVSYALKFSSIEPDAPAIVSCTATGYENVPGFNDFQPIARNRDFFLGVGQQHGLYDRLLETDDLYNALVWLQKTYDTYGGFDDRLVKSVEAEAANDLNTLHGLVARYCADPLGSFTMPELRSLAHGMPELQYIVDSFPKQGGDGGSEFNDVDPASFIPRLTRIKRIELRSGVNIDSLIVTYVDASGVTRKYDHGGGGGTLQPPLALLDNERVTEILGRSGSLVDRLDIHTSLRKSLSGGGDGGKGFFWSLPSGRFLLGFSGCSGTLLDSLKAVWGRFEPAVWRPRARRKPMGQGGAAGA